MSSRSAWLSAWGYSNPAPPTKRPLKEKNIFRTSVSVVSAETFAPPAPEKKAKIEEPAPTLDDLAPEVAEKQIFVLPSPPAARRKSNRLKKK